MVIDLRISLTNWPKKGGLKMMNFQRLERLGARGMVNQRILDLPFPCELSRCLHLPDWSIL